MATIQFSHANGFPAGSYNCFLKHLDKHTVNFIPALGLDKFKVKNNWKPLVDELIINIEASENKPVVAVGHSLGGVVSYMAAQQRPDLFSHIILLDPPFFRPLKRWVIEALIFMNKLDKYPHPANKSKFRRTQFSSRDEAYSYFKNKALFKHASPECLTDYITHGLTEHKQGYVLKIPREIEVRIFLTMPLILPTRKLKIPAHFLYSNQFEAMEPKDLKWVKRRMPFFEFIEIEGSHLFPFEKPSELANLIDKIIAEH
jgi:pimeloyl-ACP methyl ester carboxylesterase